MAVGEGDPRSHRGAREMLPGAGQSPLKQTGQDCRQVPWRGLFNRCEPQQDVGSLEGLKSPQSSTLVPVRLTERGV